MMQAALLADPVLAAPRARASKRHYDPGATSEWYTPAWVLAAARRAMGAIDLDPASCAEANVTVQAACYYDRQADGLRQRWHGRVWCNPPYSDYPGQAATWAAKMLAEYEAARVQQAILLVNLSVAYQPAFQALAQAGALICLVNRRIAFVGGAQGSGDRRPTQANALYYLGGRKAEFAEVFGRFGVVVAAWGEVIQNV